MRACACACVCVCFFFPAFFNADKAHKTLSKGQISEPVRLGCNGTIRFRSNIDYLPVRFVICVYWLVTQKVIARSKVLSDEEG